MALNNKYLAFTVQADVENTGDIVTAIDNGADGIGLFRTELICLDNAANEEAQYQYYLQAFAKCNRYPITVRTFDGGLKIPPFGLHGIRYSMANPGIFRIQLRALLRAGQGCNLRVVVPGVADIEQFKWAKEQLQVVRKQLKEQDILANYNTPLGMMVEIPAVVISLEMFTHESNFFTINADRLLNLLMASDFDDFMHPALLRSIKQIIDAKIENRLDVMVCGKMTELKQVIPILKGIGVSGIATRSGNIPKIRDVLSHLDYENAMRIAAKSLVLSSSDKIKDYVNSALNKLCS